MECNHKLACACNRSSRVRSFPMEDPAPTVPAEQLPLPAPVGPVDMRKAIITDDDDEA